MKKMNQVLETKQEPKLQPFPFIAGEGYLFTQYWFTLMYQYTVYAVIILGYSRSPYLLFSVFNIGPLYYTNVI